MEKKIYMAPATKIKELKLGFALNASIDTTNPTYGLTSGTTPSVGTGSADNAGDAGAKKSVWDTDYDEPYE